MSAHWLTYIAKYHNEYLKIVRSWGESDYAEDIVQEMYLRINRYTSEDKIVNNGEVNKAYVWFVLRNIYNDLKKHGNRIDIARLSDKFDVEDEDIDEAKHGFEIFSQRLNDEIDSWHWYDAMLFKVYKDSDITMRELADKTKISLSSIYNTLKNCKERVQENCSEHYEDFLNEDYERI